MTINETPTAQDELLTSDKDTTIVVNEQLFCALTGKPIAADEAFWAPPLITARDLISAVIKTITHTPGNLGQLLFTEQPNVPYAQDARELLNNRRNTEQLKLLVGLLLIAALIAAPIFFLTMS